MNVRGWMRGCMCAAMLVGVAGQAAGAAQGGAVHAYDLPAQSLTKALTAFARASGVRLAYAAELTKGRKAPALHGTFSREAALDRLLEGSDLVYQVDGSGVVTILDRSARDFVAQGAVQLEEIIVEGKGNEQSPVGPGKALVATRSLTGTKTNASILETPQTINVVTAEQIRVQAAQTVSEALRYTPGVRTEGYGVDGPFDSYTLVRGFRADIFVDGMRGTQYGSDGLSGATIDPFLLERIEVLKGPASALYGQSGPGGLINLVSKRPTELPLHAVELQAGNFGRAQTSFDFGGPVDPKGEFLYRVAGTVRRSGSQIDFAQNDRIAIAPAVTWRPTEQTGITFLGSYQQDKGIWSFFNYMPAIGSLYPFNGQRIATSRFLGEPDYNRLSRAQGAVGYLAEHRINGNFALVQNLRYSSNDFFTRGAFTGRSSLNPDGSIDRLSVDIDQKDALFVVDNQARFNGLTGPFAHNGVVGVDYRRERLDYIFNAGAGPSLNVFTPVYGSPVGPANFSVQSFVANQSQIGVYANDQIKLGRILATLSGRHDWASTNQRNRDFDLATTSLSNQNAKAFTGRAGLTYLLDYGFAPYASYATSFQPEIGVDGSTNQPFKPSTGQQVEAGIKYQPPGMNALVTLAAFDISQQNRITVDQAFLQRQIGEVNVRGIELEGKAQVSENINLLAAYAHLVPKITKSSNDAEVGNILFSTPQDQASGWGDYTFRTGPVAGLTLGGGVRYTGFLFDTTNTIRVPAVTLFDARIAYDLGRLAPSLAGASIALNATNLFDRTYISQCDGATMCTYGSRRFVLATLRYRW